MLNRLVRLLAPAFVGLAVLFSSPLAYALPNVGFIDSFLASDGSRTDGVVISWGVTNGTSCSPSSGGDIYRDGVLLQSGASSGYLDTSAVPSVVYSYTLQYEDCDTLGRVFTTPNTGYRSGGGALNVTQGTYNDGVHLDWTHRRSTPGECGAVDSVTIYRDGVPLMSGTVEYPTGSAVDATAVPFQTYTYRVHVQYADFFAPCNPPPWNSPNVTGWRGMPDPTITATDGSFSDHVAVHVEVAGGTGCSGATRTLHITRQGLTLATQPIPVTPLFTFNYDDYGGTVGHKYTYIAYVDDAACGVGPSITDTGYSGASTGASGAALPPTSVVATDGAFSDHVDVTANFPTQAMGCAWNATVFRDGTQVYSGVLVNAALGPTTGTYSDYPGNSAVHVYKVVVSASGNAFGGPTPCGLSESLTDSGFAGAPAAPAAISNVQATDGTIVDVVNVTWDLVPGVPLYQVIRCPNVIGEPAFAGPGNAGALSIAGSACSPVGSQVAAGPVVDSVPGVANTLYKYAVYGVSADTVTFGPVSASDGGYPDRAPTAATAAGSIGYGATAPIAITPNVVDVNTSEVFTFSTPITATSRGGSVSVVASALQYTPPAVAFNGTDNFTFVATDKAGASVGGTGVITSGCVAPTVSAVSVSPSHILPNAGFRVLVTYGNGNCPHLTTAAFDVTGPSAVPSQGLPSVAAATSGTLSFDFPGISYPGTYNMTVRLTDTVDGTVATKAQAFVVGTFRMPAIVTPAPVFEFIETAKLSVGSTPDCVLTTSEASAAADITKCLVSATGLPTGVALVPAAPLPTWSGSANARLLWDGPIKIADSTLRCKSGRFERQAKDIEARRARRRASRHERQVIGELPFAPAKTSPAASTPRTSPRGAISWRCSERSSDPKGSAPRLEGRDKVVVVEEVLEAVAIEVRVPTRRTPIALEARHERVIVEEVREAVAVVVARANPHADHAGGH